MIQSSRRKNSRKKGSKKGSLAMPEAGPGTLPQYSSLRRAYGTEQEDEDRQVYSSAMGVQGAYETTRAKDVYHSASDMDLGSKPGTGTHAEAPPNMGINGTLYVAPRPSNRIRLKEKRESSSSVKTNPFKAASPEKGANPYFERQTVNLQGQA